MTKSEYYKATIHYRHDVFYSMHRLTNIYGMEHTTITPDIGKILRASEDLWKTNIQVCNKLVFGHQVIFSNKFCYYLPNNKTDI